MRTAHLESRDGLELGRSDWSESDSGAIRTFLMTWSTEGRAARAGIMRTGVGRGMVGRRETCVYDE